MSMKRIIYTLTVIALVMSVMPFHPVAAVWNGDFDLSDVNGDNVVDNLDAALILQYDAGIIKSFPYVERKISDDRFNSIAAAYFDYLCEEDPRTASEFTADDVSVYEYFGTYSGCDVLYMQAPIDITEAYRYEEAAGYIIVFPNGLPLWVYKDGRFYRLSEAYEDGLISKEDVFNIGLNFGVFPEGVTMEDAEQGRVTDVIYTRVGDANGDFAVNNLDAALILQYDAGIIDSPKG